MSLSVLNNFYIFLINYDGFIKVSKFSAYCGTVLNYLMMYSNDCLALEEDSPLITVLCNVYAFVKLTVIFSSLAQFHKSWLIWYVTYADKLQSFNRTNQQPIRPTARVIFRPIQYGQVLKSTQGTIWLVNHRNLVSFVSLFSKLLERSPPLIQTSCSTKIQTFLTFNPEDRWEPWNYPVLPSPGSSSDLKPPCGSTLLEAPRGRARLLPTTCWNITLTSSALGGAPGSFRVSLNVMSEPGPIQTM